MTLETRIKEYYCDYAGTMRFRGQYKTHLFWKLSFWSDMFYNHPTLESAQSEVDEYIKRYEGVLENCQKPTRYHKYP